ncbi:hypothetical protein JW977_00315 [Candidatus Falkowbacteria bacterium]|nr:hypothetical protein [Candidatus Falkowbacteria bacterium]
MKQIKLVIFFLLIIFFITGCNSGANKVYCYNKSGDKKMSLDEAINIAKQSECANDPQGFAVLDIENNQCQQLANRWILTIKDKRNLCSVYCYVDIETKKASLEWRCMGWEPWAADTSNLKPANKILRDPVTIEILITNTGFESQGFDRRVGDTIKWINQDTVPHKIIVEGTGGFVSPILNHNESYSHIFTESGHYSYYCSDRPSIVPILIINEAI